MSLRIPGTAALTLLAAIVAAGCGGGAREEPALPASESSVRAAAANPVTVSPLPGTRDASPASQISFLGGTGTKISDVHVVGSRSRAHARALRAYSTGTGESFLPAHPFLAGEKVTVRARVRVGAGTRAAAT